jgi:hypothetical protein
MYEAYLDENGEMVGCLTRIQPRENVHRNPPIVNRDQENGTEDIYEDVGNSLEEVQVQSGG